MHQRATGVVCFSFFFWLRVLDKAEWILSFRVHVKLCYRIVSYD